ncbi:acyl-CoA dehydrogenase family protein [Streptomyces sp. XM4011]|uniref:acyl-CoA dehydrogenase family protein n=1 Tax=Streptomyces sp. XM4011 TaxID=2929780 RepID=UPI001FFAE993|nr:acyl-CoA dehydrogenase family protein [Streptomyces sp. XM4011]MCK1816379.1 acyl-CoA dehydrogenase family protein [Streptomyces sp. XM4011]
MRDDHAERFPAEALATLDAWGYRALQVPEEYGGRLTSLEELSAIGRVVAGRDPAVTLIANSPLGAAMPVWLAGSTAQRRAVADAVLGGAWVALGITERAHGADLLASETTVRRDGDGYLVDGEKWLINNAGRARYVCLLARHPDRTGMRSLSFVLMDLAALPPTAYTILPRITTHGMRAAQIAGIRFHGARVPAGALIGRPGSGLELASAALAITRTLVPALSLGVLETALRCCTAFLRDRRLYGGAATDIPYVREELAAALVDLRAAEAVARACVRAPHLLPDLVPVTSAVTKYLVPRAVEDRMRQLAVVLGSRSYLREGHWSGLFEKLRRDVTLFGLFDGSEPVVLSALTAQASCLDVPADPRRADALFTPETTPGPLFGHATGPFADDDPVTAGTGDACAALARHTADPVLTEAAAVLRAAGERVRAEAGDALDARSLAGQQFADRYARLFAATCLARTALAAGEAPPWLGPGLLALLEPGRRMPAERAAALWNDVLAHAATGPAGHPGAPVALLRGGEAR